MSAVTRRMIAVANEISTSGKGILAADESIPTIGKRFEKIHLANTEENRRAYRSLLCTTANLGDSISAIILTEETLHQKTQSGIPFVDILADNNIIIGVKVDCGTTPLFTSSPFPELITQGLDDLGPRLVRIFDAGALFAKWRAVFTLDVHRGLPSQECIDSNCRALAQYAAICQSKGIVPILEPEILMEGNFTFEESGKCTERVLGKLYECCRDAGVVLEATLLKPSMVCEGTETRKQRHDIESPAPQDTGDRERSSYANAVALHTLSALMHAVPIAVPGVMFLSGGQSEDEAVDNLDAISSLGALGIVSTETCAPSSFPSLSSAVPSASSSDVLMTLPMPDDEAAMEEKAELIAWGGLARRTRNVMKAPWTLSFSFGRALQTSVLRVWNGSDDNREEAQRVLQERVRAASLASKGLREESRRTTAAFSSKTVHGDAGGGPYGLMNDGL